MRPPLAATFDKLLLVVSPYSAFIAAFQGMSEYPIDFIRTRMQTLDNRVIRDEAHGS